jgi:transcriptional regulator with XRE-family HTH domain
LATLKQIFGANLRQARRVKGWTQATLAEAGNLSLDMIGRLERGTVGPSFETIEILAKALNVSPIGLFTGQLVKTGKPSDRAQLLNKIAMQLSNATDVELRRIEKVISASLES